MTRWQACVGEGASPVLVPDRFSMAAFLLGPLWLAWRGIYWPAFALFGAELLLRLAPTWLRAPTGLGLMVLTGLLARDVWVVWLRRRGFALQAVVLGRDRTDALRRLLDARPDLARAML